MSTRIVLASLALLATASNAEEIVVPDDFPTIQGAIDAASDGDVVRIKPGVYLENLSLAGKTITLESTDGPEVTIIDANDSGTVITLESGEGPETLIRGLTLTGGNATGSAIYCFGSSPTVEDNVIRNNSASSLGAATWFEQSAAVIRGNLIEDNVRDGIHAVSCALVIEQNTIRGNGRGIYCRQSQGRIANNLIEDNSSTSSDSGGMRIDVSSTILIEDNLILNNSASSGGGILVTNGSQPLIRHNVIQGNSTLAGSGTGGGLSFDNAMADVRENQILGNHAVDGGGVFFWLDSGGSLQGNRISGNVAENQGGGIRSEAPSVELRGNSIDHNSAIRGGGLYATGLSTAQIIDCEVAWNNAERGAGIFSAGVCHATLRNGTLLGNLASISGGGIATEENGTVDILDSILWVDFAPLGPEIHSPNGGATAAWSVILGGWPGTGISTADPKFVDVPGADYRLKPDSPCIDAGNPAAAPLGTDMEGMPRNLDGNLDFVQRVDMGAHEFGHVRLEPIPPVAPGGSFTLLGSGTAGMLVVVALGVGQAALPLAPYGLLLLDPFQLLVPVLTGGVPISAGATISDPYGGPAQLFFQAIALNTVTGAGTFSNSVTLEVVAP